MSLGASRLRVVRDTLSEAVVLAVAGGALGTILAYEAVVAMAATAPIDLPRLQEVGVDGRVLGFSLALSLGRAPDRVGAGLTGRARERTRPRHG